MAITIHE